jgi:hypothetical protein
MNASTRWLVAIAGIVAVTVVVSTLVAVFADGEQEFEPGTPEAVVQSYLRAVADRDATRALSFLGEPVHDECAEIPRQAITQRGNTDFRATLEETFTTSDGAVVEVAITETYDGAFGGDSTWTYSFFLEQEDGEWLFSEVPWPFYCSRYTELRPARY